MGISVIVLSIDLVGSGSHGDEPTFKIHLTENKVPENCTKKTVSVPAIVETKFLPSGNINENRFFPKLYKHIPKTPNIQTTRTKNPGPRFIRIRFKNTYEIKC